MEYHSAIRMSQLLMWNTMGTFKSIMPSERGQTCRATPGVIPFIRLFTKDKTVGIGIRSVVARAEYIGVWGNSVGDRKSLHIDFGASDIIVPMYYNYTHFTSNKGRLLSVCTLYPRNPDLKETKKNHLESLLKWVAGLHPQGF